MTKKDDKKENVSTNIIYFIVLGFKSSMIDKLFCLLLVI